MIPSLVPNSYMKDIIRHAKPRKARGELEVKIDLPYLEKLFIEQKGKCYYTNAPISFKDSSASLDRTDNDKGYIPGNVRWVHKDVNMMKRHYDEDYFIKLCLMITDRLDTPG